MNKFYITTAIDYPNGSPHLGHAYEKIVSDCYARWYRLLNHKTYFLTGTDENGQKLQESAKLAGRDTKEFVDSNVSSFIKLCNDLNISHDDFIRTTEDRHKRVCCDIWNRLNDNGDIYFGKYSGLYCLSCENFYSESQAPDKICPNHFKPLEEKSEDGYFFKISKYYDFILNHIKNNSNFIVPKKSSNEIINRLEQEPLKDIAFSRLNKGWGIEIPNNKEFVMYTWCDALVNYYSALVDKKVQDKFWPADVHVIGKDITWFHCVIWPCMLHAIGIALPKQIYVHGMILAEDGKAMSKSLGNVISPDYILGKYPVDTFRYYLLRAIPSLSDGLFSEKELVDRHNNELGNDFGNLIMRILKLSIKNKLIEIEGLGMENELPYEETFEKMKNFMTKREHNKACDSLWEYINNINQYINNKEPWKLKDDPEKFKSVIYNCVYAIHAISVLLSPYMPSSSIKALEWIGISKYCIGDLEFGKINYKLTQPKSLFSRID